YRIRVTNTGKATIRVTVRDIVPKGLASVKGQKLQKGAVVQIVTLKPGQARNFIVKMKVVAPKGKVCNIVRGTTPGVVAKTSRACVTILPKPAPKKVPVTG
ncbi:MAG: DUF11 domain-containing protein, partial [Crocinitomicaceae bacterium]